MKLSICTIPAESFQQEIIDEKKPVLLLCTDHNSDFPEQFLILQEFAEKMHDLVKVAILAEDFMEAFQQSYDVTGTPTFLLFVQGREKGRLLGHADVTTLGQWIRELRVLH